MIMRQIMQQQIEIQGEEQQKKCQDWFIVICQKIVHWCSYDSARLIQPLLKKISKYLNFSI